MQFSFKRFSCLFKVQLATNRKLYLLGIAALAGTLLAFMLFFMFLNKGLGYDTQVAIFFIGLVLSSCIFTTTLFGQFAEKSQRIQAVMLPVSPMERMAVAILLSVVVFPLVYLLVCLGCLRLINYLDIYWMGNTEPLFQLNDGNAHVYFIIYYYLQAVVLLGAIWFRRYTFVRTAVMISLVVVGTQSFNDFIAQSILGNAQPENREAVNRKLEAKVGQFQYDGATPYANIRVSAFTEAEKYSGQEYYMVELQSGVKVLMMIVIVLTPFFLWYITLLKLREQQL